MSDIKITPEQYSKHRNETLERYNFKEYKACYCGHTNTCDCPDPGIWELQANSKKELVANIPTLKESDI